MTLFGALEEARKGILKETSFIGQYGPQHGIYLDPRWSFVGFPEPYWPSSWPFKILMMPPIWPWSWPIWTPIWPLSWSKMTLSRFPLSHPPYWPSSWPKITLISNSLWPWYDQYGPHHGLHLGRPSSWPNMTLMSTLIWPIHLDFDVCPIMALILVILGLIMTFIYGPQYGLYLDPRWLPKAILTFVLT